MGSAKMLFNTALPVGKDIEDGRPGTIIHFDDKGNITGKVDFNMENFQVSQEALESLARVLLSTIEEYLSSEEGKHEWDEFQKQHPEIPEKKSKKSRK